MLKKYLHITLFIMLFSSSLMAVEIQGVSINKIGMIPFVAGVYLWLFQNASRVVIAKNTKLYLIFLLFSCVSALFGIVMPITDVDGMTSACMNYIIQVILLFVPIILFVCGKDSHKYGIKECFFRQIVFISRFHAIWIVAQFIIFTLFSINISSVLFDDILGGVTNVNWNSFVYGSIKVIRASGLNRDPAFSSFIMMCGFVFDRNPKIRWIYVICPVLAQSRTGAVVLLGLVILSLLINESSRAKIKELLPKILFILVALVVVIYFLIKSEALMGQFVSILERFTDIFSSGGKDLSTARHSAYPILAIETYSSFNNPLNWLLGIGPRASGLALIAKFGGGGLYGFTTDRVWSIECDFAEILLGYGIIGFVLFYYIMLRFVRSKNSYAIMFGVAMIVMSFMYNYSSLSFVMIVIIFMISIIERKYRVNEKNSYYSSQLQATTADN